MKYTILEKTDKSRFENCFKNHIPCASTCLLSPSGVELGENCGYIEKNRFSIWKNIGARNPRMLFLEKLDGEIKEDGTVTYKFSKRTDGNILTMGFIIMLLIAAIISWTATNDWVGSAVLFSVSLVFFILHSLHSKTNRERLLFTLETIVNEANNKI